MAYIILDRTKSVANGIAELDAHAIELQQEATRLMNQINSITVGGTQPANLETLGIPAGQGATVYSNVHDVIYLNAIAMNSTILASMDNG